MKQQIYQNGFYLMIGLILGVFITLISTPKSQPVESNIKVEVIKDSVRVTPVKKAPEVQEYKSLSEANLKAELKKQNVPHAHIVLAQAKLESGLGKSSVYRRTNNLFGLRKGNKYRSYSHWTECVKDYKRLISSKYKGGSYYSFLVNSGYAEDPNYVDKLKKLV